MSESGECRRETVVEEVDGVSHSLSGGVVAGDVGRRSQAYRGKRGHGEQRMVRFLIDFKRRKKEENI